MHSEYLSMIQQLINTIDQNEKESIEQSANILANTFANDGILHVFGCGHSHMIAEEVFYRAGGVVPVKPILMEDLMLHKGALRSSQLEKNASFASTFVNDLTFQPTDTLLVVSTSGRNPVPIDVAIHGKTQGIKVISISSHYYHYLTSRHHTGKLLAEVVDISINNHIPQGDALLPIDQLKENVGPGSTIANVAIINSVIIKSVELLAQQGRDVPIFKSGNMDGAELHNKRLVEKYEKRIELF